MNLLVRNEFMKLKRLKSVYLVLLFGFFPYIVNTMGLFFMDIEFDWEKYYMFVYNQYAVLLPTVIFIFSGFYFNIEFKNKTVLNWMAYPYNKFQLIISKILAIYFLLFGISFVNHIIHLTTLWLVFKNDILFSELLTLFLTSMIFTVLSLLIIPIAGLVAFMTKNIVVVMILGVASFFIMTVLLGADLSIIFPFSYIYRISIQTYISSMGYSEIGLQTGGAVILAAYVSISLLGLYLYSKKVRVF
ncbi:ABC transporter permease [Metabacillus arenae]|uniref:ABC transporter permease n=1 Tax=Metabacillus arenae TaxID=2771434 RepID=A0A926RXI4_9BACI|nr:ABC transporter permease [Metabacillus arenae]MBD1381031.1 ABC transporter permease [Metabacillus arenae]